MRPSSGLLVAGMLAAVVIAGTMRAANARQRRLDTLAARRVAVTPADSSRGVTQKALVPAGAAPAPDPGDLRRRVSNLAPGTYVADILAQQDSVLYRWPERLGDAVRVWVEPQAALPDWNAAYPDMARIAFDEWGEAGFPVRFTFVYDPANVDIAIRWVDRFPADAGQRIGQTERVQTGDFLIHRANLTIATHDSTGRALSPANIAGVVRHEVGHALGLNHASDPTSVMYHESATSTIGASDRATLRLLYLVPAGRLK